MSIVQALGNDDDGNLVQRGTIYDTYPELARKHQEFEDVMLTAVNSDPQLNASVHRLLQLKSAVQNYETPAQERRREAREEEAAED
jgi:beta-glucosidase-like glycosyl hydrolase